MEVESDTQENQIAQSEQAQAERKEEEEGDVELQCPEGREWERLDKFLSSHLNLSRKHVAQLIRNHNVTINNHPAHKLHYKVKPGDSLTIARIALPQSQARESDESSENEKSDGEEIKASADDAKDEESDESDEEKEDSETANPSKAQRRGGRASKQRNTRKKRADKPGKRDLRMQTRGERKRRAKHQTIPLSDRAYNDIVHSLKTAPPSDHSSTTLYADGAPRRVKKDGYLEIDGSILEGGGQILRVVIALAALLRIPLHVTQIRAGRSNPGLMAQHFSGIHLIAQLFASPACLEGVTQGSTELYFDVGAKTPLASETKFTADSMTAGSISLLIQVALPCLYFFSLHRAREVTLKGGTNTKGAPHIDYVTGVTRPILKEMGVGFGLEIERRGYYPMGGGEVRLKLHKKNSEEADEMCFGLW